MINSFVHSHGGVRERRRAAGAADRGDHRRAPAVRFRRCDDTAVAAEAGAPLASIHYTFGSLDDLVLASFERLLDEVSLRVTTGLDVAAGYGPCIVDIMRRVAGLLDDERYGVLLHDLNPTGDRRVEALEERYYRLAHDLVDTVAAAQPREPALPRAQLARLVMASIDGVVLQFAATGDVAAARDDLTAFGRILGSAAELGD